jgi:tRNA(fMet)-specific endonuclease VapC
MNLLFDTNILVQLSKDASQRLFNSITNNNNDRTYLSIVTLGELRSIALQNNWGEAKWLALEPVIKKSGIIEVNESLINIYVEIDAYSQRRNPSFHDYQFATPRNMGKNDLWIAATAAFLDLTLVTTDKDFNHLHEVFMEVRRITPEIFM